jgi:hypothetical protein
MRIEAPKWISALGDVAARVGMDVGVAALKSQLGALGIGVDMIPLVEQELNRQGLTLGTLAQPPRLPTFATFATIQPRKKAA